jgi:hypothetical protein
MEKAGIRKQGSGTGDRGSGIGDSPNPDSGRVKKVGVIAGRRKMKIKRLLD